MKKSILLIGLIVMLLASMYFFTGCGDNKKGTGYSKETQKYSVLSPDKTGELVFEFAKDLPYAESKGLPGSFVLKSSENYSEIKARLVHDYANSATITKEEKDFYSDKYHDYQKVTYGDYKGWCIYNGEYSYEISLILTEPTEEDHKVYAANIEVRKSPVMKDDMTFDVKEFVESEDFQHLLNSIKFNFVDTVEE